MLSPKAALDSILSITAIKPESKKDSRKPITNPVINERHPKQISDDVNSLGCQSGGAKRAASPLPSIQLGGLKNKLVKLKPELQESPQPADLS
jgi:hypothetical protein